jgi:hypothetical protein
MAPSLSSPNDIAGSSGGRPGRGEADPERAIIVCFVGGSVERYEFKGNRALSKIKENIGEVLFERYLSHWGYGDYERHPERLNPPKKPDYLIRTECGEVVVEVKSFDTWGLLEKLKDEPFAMESLEETLGPIRDAIKEAAKQLKGIEGRPLVIVLVSPDNRIPVSPYYLISAMYGELELPIPLDQARSEQWRTGRNGRLYIPDGRGVRRGYHPYVSAVAVIRESPHPPPASTVSDSEVATETQALNSAVTLEVFETISDRCIPLPRTLFAYEGDRRWGALGGGFYGRLALTGTDTRAQGS